MVLKRKEYQTAGQRGRCFFVLARGEVELEAEPELERTPLYSVMPGRKRDIGGREQIWHFAISWKRVSLDRVWVRFLERVFRVALCNLERGCWLGFSPAWFAWHG